MDYGTPGFPVFHHLPEVANMHVHWVSDAIQPPHPLLSPSLSAFNLSQIRIFSNELALHIRWPKYWSFSFSISPSNEYSGLISFRIDWFDLPADQGTLKSLLQHHSSKASILSSSAFFMVQLSHPYMTVGKTIALIRQPLSYFVKKLNLLKWSLLTHIYLHVVCNEKNTDRNFPAGPVGKGPVLPMLCSAFFMVQLSHPYMTTGKTIALNRWTFVGKVMSLLSRLVIAFLPGSKRLLISWLQSPSAVILEPRKIKSATVSTVSPSICHEVMGPDAMILVFWMLSFKATF